MDTETQVLLEFNLKSVLLNVVLLELSVLLNEVSILLIKSVDLILQEDEVFFHLSVGADSDLRFAVLDLPALDLFSSVSEALVEKISFSLKSSKFLLEVLNLVSRSVVLSSPALKFSSLFSDDIGQSFDLLRKHDDSVLILLEFLVTSESVGLQAGIS